MWLIWECRVTLEICPGQRIHQLKYTYKVRWNMKLGKGLLSPARSQNKRKGGGCTGRAREGWGGGGRVAIYLKVKKTKRSLPAHSLFYIPLSCDETHLVLLALLRCFALLCCFIQVSMMSLLFQYSQSSHNSTITHFVLWAALRWQFITKHFVFLALSSATIQYKTCRLLVCAEAGDNSVGNNISSPCLRWGRRQFSRQQHLNPLSALRPVTIQ